MYLSFMSFSLIQERLAGKMDADTLVSLAAKNGLTSMDMIGFEFDLYGKEALLAAFEKYGVKCNCVITGAPFYTGSEDTIREALRKYLELSAELGNSIMMLIPDQDNEEVRAVLATMTMEERMQKAVDGYRIAVEMAKEYGITIGFENTPHYMKPLASADDCEYLMKQVPGLKLIFDTGNFRVADTGCDELAIYEQLKEYIVRVHLKDVVVGPFDSGEQCVDSQFIRCVSSGSGIIPIKELVHRLERDGYDGALAVEYAASSELHGDEHVAPVGVYVDYISSCLKQGEPAVTQYATIEGVDKPVSRVFFGTAIGPMLMGKNVDYILDAAMSYGFNTFDCARGYGGAEHSLGMWMKARNNRERVVVMSKCGNCAPDGSVLVNRQVIERELEESLATLGTDYIDIYLLHRDDPKTPISEFIDTLNEAQRAGKIRIFGVSNWTHQRIQEANDYAAASGQNGFTVSSPNFGLADQISDPWGGDCVTITGAENEEARQWYRNNQMPVIAYSSLARGLMAGRLKSTDEDRAAELLDEAAVKGYVCHENFRRLALAEKYASEHGLTVAETAIGWMFTQGMNMFASACTTKVSRIKGLLIQPVDDFLGDGVFGL